MDKYGTGTDPYTYPNTNILKNKLNIRAQQELDIIEYQLTELAILNIEFQAPPYSFEDWRYLHND